MWRNIVVWAIWQIACIFLILFGSDAIFGGLKYNNEMPFYWKQSDWDEATVEARDHIVVGEGTPKLTVYTMVF